MRMRIGRSRVSSSMTSAVRPATRPMMKMQPRKRRRESHVVKHRRQRAIDVDGHRLDLLRDRGAERLHEQDAVAGQAMPPGEVEQHRRARIVRMHAMTEAGDALADRAMLGRRSSPAHSFERERFAPRALDARARSSPCTRIRRRRARRRRRGCRPRSPPTPNCDCPRAPAAPWRTTARPSRGPRTLDRIASNSARSASDRQPRSMQQEDGVGERALCHQRRHVVSAQADLPSLASTMAVRQGSIGLLKLCEGTGYTA